MFDVRCALPAVPFALCVGLWTISAAADRGLPPTVAQIAGGAAATVTAVIVHRAAAGWSERARRLVGYVASVLIGLVTGAILAFSALAVSLCGTWGETCTPDETALMGRLLLSAVGALVGVPLLYAILDQVTLRRR